MGEIQYRRENCMSKRCALTFKCSIWIDFIRFEIRIVLNSCTFNIMGWYFMRRVTCICFSFYCIPCAFVCVRVCLWCHRSGKRNGVNENGCRRVWALSLVHFTLRRAPFVPLLHASVFFSLSIFSLSLFSSFSLFSPSSLSLLAPVSLLFLWSVSLQHARRLLILSSANLFKQTWFTRVIA